MRTVRCEECGKRYDFDLDDFCPRCGAFNQPPRASRIAADGSVTRVEGIHEGNHSGSFTHAEFHEENRQRRGTPLAQGIRWSTSEQARSGAGGAERPFVSKSPLRVIGWIVTAIILLNLLGSLLTFLR